MAMQTARAELLVRLARSCSAMEVRALIAELLDAAGLDRDERVEVLGGAMVTEAVRPYWNNGCRADEAHEALLLDDPELGEVVEAIAPMLLGRAEAREESRRLIREIEESITPRR